MGLLDEIGGLLNQGGGAASAADVHDAYDQVSQAVPHQDLADGLAHAFRSDDTPPFGQMLANLFDKSSPEQKAGILNQVVAALGSDQVAKMLGGAGGAGGALGGLLESLQTHGTVTPAQASQVSPEAVNDLAAKAAQKDPSIIDSAASFYAHHSTLVKAIGAGALTLLMRRIALGNR